MNFEETYKYVKNNKRLDISKFNKVSDITNMIDYINNEEQRKKDARFDEDVAQMAKELVNNAGKEYFFLSKYAPKKH